MSDLRLATRGSPLALAQAELVAGLLARHHEGLMVEIVIVETTGDKVTEVPLSVLGGQGVFAKEVQTAVLEGAADVAVHSAKDLPSTSPEGLVLCAIPERQDPADVLVGRSLAGLGPGATVATGSPRRKALLESLRPDLEFVELRGNMATRLSTPGTRGVDAVVAAAAALHRLGRSAEIAERLDPEIFTPQVGQGAIGLEVHVDGEARALLAAINDTDAATCVAAERAFLVAIGAGCTVPAGAWCTAEGPSLTLRAVMANDEGPGLRRIRLTGTDPNTLGHEAAVALGASQ